MLIVPYGDADDYMSLAMAEHLGLSSPPYAKSLAHYGAAEGRPIWGVVANAAFSAAGTIDNLRYVRIISVAGILALALVLYWALVRSKLGRTPAALIALLVCTLPPFQAYAAWAVMLHASWTALLAGCASLLAVAAVDAPRRLRPERLMGATLLLLVALLTYQSAAMFFWSSSPSRWQAAWPTLGARYGWRACTSPSRPSRRVSRFSATSSGISLIGEDAIGASRGTLTHDVSGKAEWFWNWALYGSLNLFDITWSAWLAAFVATVAVVGIVLWVLRHATRPWLYIGLAALLVPITVVPNLVVEETYQFVAYRTLVSLSALIALYFGLGALALWVMFREWLEGRVSGRALLVSERVATGLAIAFVATGIVTANRNVDTLYAEPQLRELRLLRGQVAAMPDPVRNVAFVLSRPEAERVPGSPLSDEFGHPSTSPWYGAEPLVLLLLREQGRLAPPHPSVSVLPWYTTTTPEGAGVVNLNGQLRPP